MARTTGFPCVITAIALARGRFAEPGVYAPEAVAVRGGWFGEMTGELKKRGVVIRHAVEELEA
jgi:saccharopine dehydrogenase-like NADP-dependent oxidoreductase